MTTNMISTSLDEFNAGVLQPSPLKGNLIPRLQVQRGWQKRIHTHHCGGGNSGYLEQRKSSISHVASCSK
jgi:hypothetical protein